MGENEEICSCGKDNCVICVNERLKELFTKDDGLFCKLKKIINGEVDNIDGEPITDELLGKIIKHYLSSAYVFQEYLNSPKRIMYCGQQGNSSRQEYWFKKGNAEKNFSKVVELCCKNCCENVYNFQINKTMEYENSDIEENIENIVPFWKFARKIAEGLKLPNLKSLYYTNLFKLEEYSSGKGAKPIDSLIKLELNLKIIKQEIKIVEPDVMIFTALQGYDTKYNKEYAEHGGWSKSYFYYLLVMLRLVSLNCDYDIFDDVRNKIRNINNTKDIIEFPYSYKNKLKNDKKCKIIVTPHPNSYFYDKKGNPIYENSEGYDEAVKKLENLARKVIEEINSYNPSKITPPSS